MKTRVASAPLADLLDRYTALGAPELCRPEGEHLRCLACGHRCLIGAGLRGICKVRYNEAGQLKVPFGYIAGMQCDPVEKKPYFHVYPGSDALTFGMMGCDYHCDFCQNWLTSQALRDSQAIASIRPVTPAQIVETALCEGARLVVSSYNEPLITAEWAVAVFRAASAAGLACGFVSNGNATPEVLDFLRPWIVSYKVDLKGFDDRAYRTLGGTLDSVLRTIRMVHERGLWLEVVTLIIPGFNDSTDELRRAADFLASISPDIPWHVTAFHKDYRLTEPDPTSAETLIRAAELGTAAGLRYVYAGNLPGRVGQWENTRCPTCRTTVIERYGYLIRSYRLTSDGRCPECQAHIPGLWPASPEQVRTGDTVAAYQGRRPRAVPVVSSTSSPSEGLLPMADAAPSIPAPALGLTAQQKQEVLAAVGAMVRASAVGTPAAFPAALAELSQRRVAGAFVSLKRGRHLRSCCGMMGAPIALAQAVAQAADRAIWEDERFPPVSPSELDHLDLELWLLANPQPSSVPAAERTQAIILGKHGIVVQRGQARGLFLPGVATENNWNAERFLDQVCVKAGLHPTAWRDETTTLLTFEGEALRVPLGEVSGPRCADRVAGLCQHTEVAAYAELCRANVQAILRGMFPRPFLGLPDGQVNGVVLLLQRPGAQEVQTLMRLSFRPSLPLQTTLFALLQTAAQALAARRVHPDTLDNMQVGLAILHDPAMHGTAADPHFAGFDPRHRVLVLSERNKTALVFDPAQTTEELLAEATRQVRLAQAAAASLFSLDIVTNAVRVSTSTAPQPVRGPAVRPPAVAGTFYEADPAALAGTVANLLAGARRPEPWAAALVPHAGLKFSGHLAADVLKRIRIPRTVIVLGPKHMPHGMEWAVAPHQTWALPGIEVASDFILARKLCQAIAGLELDAVAHQKEHAIEVELPLLAALAPAARVVGIALGQTDLESCRRFAVGLAEVLRGCEERPLLLISSDMNHFATDSEARRLDAMAIAALERGDPAELYETVTQHSISMCGIVPAVIVLETLRLLGSEGRCERVGYATSADVSGDVSRVVGYAGMLFR
jgi:AmmeMemoRadiSam system radical SAM enzyme/AmmeMemoRadiSam system protein B/AmmeMemoRadiSam system protein A